MKRRKRQSLAATPSLRGVLELFVLQIGSAITDLRRHRTTGDAVHELRKELLGARATLRILRACVGERAYCQANVILRDTARRLTPLRDAEVLVQTLILLSRRADERRIKEFGEQLTLFLKQEQRLSRQRLQRHAVGVASLCKVQRRVQTITANQLRRGTVSGGLTEGYKSGCKAFSRAQRRPTDTRLHEWRKQVKYFVYQIEVVQQLHIGHLTKLHHRSSRLAECLGDDHDLAVLHQTIAHFATLAIVKHRRKVMAIWVGRLTRRRVALQWEAHRLGERLYAPAPKRFRSTVERHLRAT